MFYLDNYCLNASLTPTFKKQKQSGGGRWEEKRQRGEGTEGKKGEVVVVFFSFFKKTMCN